MAKAFQTLALALCCFFLITGSAYGFRKRAAQSSATPVYTFANGSVVPADELATLLANPNTTVVNGTNSSDPSSDAGAESETAESAAPSTTPSVINQTNGTSSSAPDTQESEAAPSESSQPAETTTAAAPVDTTTAAAPVDTTTAAAPVDTTTAAAPVDTTAAAPVDLTTVPVNTLGANTAGYGSPFDIFGGSLLGGSPYSSILSGSPLYGGNSFLVGSPSLGGSTFLGGSPYLGGSTILGGSPYLGGSTILGGSPYLGGSTILGGSPYLGGNTIIGGSPFGGFSTVSAYPSSLGFGNTIGLGDSFDEFGNGFQNVISSPLGAYGGGYQIIF